MNFRRYIFSIVCIFIFSLTGCGYKIYQNGQLNKPLIDGIKQKVAAQRGLSFTGPVEVEVISREKAAEYFRDEINREYPPEKIKNMQRAYVRMGLIEPDVNLTEMVVDFYKENVAGYYDPREKKLFLIEESIRGFSLLSFIMQRDMNAEFTVAHELTHALDDQHFHFLEIEDKIGDNDDAAIAIQALEEGSATIVGFAAVYAPRLTIADMMNSFSHYDRKAETLMTMTAGDTPSIFIDSVIFAYMRGATFVAQLYQNDKGWERINGAYSRLPASSEEILYPEKYIEGNDHPIKIEIGASPEKFGENWVSLDENTFGELGIYSLMRKYVENETARQAARGWGGDGYVVVGPREGKESIWIWAAEWDSIRESQEFYWSYLTLLHKKYKNLQEVESSDKTAKCFKNEKGELIWIKCDEARVSIIEGADERTLPVSIGLTIPTVLVDAPKGIDRSRNAPNANISIP